MDPSDVAEERQEPKVEDTPKEAEEECRVQQQDSADSVNDVACQDVEMQVVASEVCVN